MLKVHGYVTRGHVMDRVQVGYWWRFSKYQIVDGVIFPADGATCERYDPWQLFDQARALLWSPVPLRSLGHGS